MAQSHKPTRGSQEERILKAMLEGVILTPISAIMDYNVLIPSARVAELRRRGWPIRSLEMPHPSDKFIGKTLTAYAFDQPFRRWYGAVDNYGKHPGEYPDTDGRGKFESWTVEDFRRGEKA